MTEPYNYPVVVTYPKNTRGDRRDFPSLYDEYLAESSPNIDYGNSPKEGRLISPTRYSTGQDSGCLLAKE